MGVDYVVDYACPVKEALSVPGLIDLVKRRDNANVILAHARQEGDLGAPSTITLRRLRQTPDGETHEDVTAQDLLDESARLHDFEGHCTCCPANLLHQPFGCYGYLAYPIPSASEEWLMARLPGDLDSTAGKILQAANSQGPFDGSHIRDMRRHQMFFDRRKPIARTWRRGLLRRWTYSSDHLLHMMIGLPQLHPTHCGVLALFLGVVPHNSPPDLVANRVAWREALAKARVGPGEGPPEVRPWINFLNAFALAAGLDVPVLIDG